MTTSKSYDLLNRLTGVVSTEPSDQVENGFGGFWPAVDQRHYSCNAANQRIGVTNVDGSYWAYGYDSLGQVTNGVKFWSDGTNVAGQKFLYTFDTIGNRLSTQAGGDASGANLRLAYYTNNLLNQITSRDAASNVDVMGLTLVNNTVQVNGTNAYQRNQYFREQMTTNNSSAPQWVGINVSAPGQTTVSGHQFVAKEPETFAYDADGNLTNDGHWAYYWDGENRLIAMSNNATIAAEGELALTFAYDYQGRRIQKTVYATNSVGGTYVPEYTNSYAYDGWNPVAILNPSAVLIGSMMWGSDLSGSLQGAGGVGGLLAENIVSNGVHFVAHDGNGNVSDLVSATNGAVTATYEYGPFGEFVRSTGPVASISQIGWSDKVRDAETGLNYYGYRYYNANIGKWISRDPIGEQGGLNSYCFIVNRPTVFIDQNGLTTVLDKKWFPGSTRDPNYECLYVRHMDDGSSDRVFLNHLTENDILREELRLDTILRSDSNPGEDQFDTRWFDGVGAHREYYWVAGESDIYAGNEINYLGIGMYEAWLGDSLTEAVLIVEGWKSTQYGQSPDDISGGTWVWLDRGYSDYDSLFGNPSAPLPTLPPSPPSPPLPPLPPPHRTRR